MVVQELESQTLALIDQAKRDLNTEDFGLYLNTVLDEITRGIAYLGDKKREQELQQLQRLRKGRKR